MNKILIISILLICGLLVFGCTQPVSPATTTNPFEKLSDTTCTENGKPIIRYFSTTWCPHCLWVNPIFDSVMQEYKDKIIVRHYVLDLNTPPTAEMEEFSKFSPNGNIPAFSFGCQYYRIGNSFEPTQDINAEKTEFRRVLDLLIS